MMAYAVMIKSTLIGMELSEAEKDQAKALFDRVYSQVFEDQTSVANKIGGAIH